MEYTREITRRVIKLVEQAVEEVCTESNCSRCEYVWIWKTTTKPRVCPRCKSQYWDKEKQTRPEPIPEPTREDTEKTQYTCLHCKHIWTGLYGNNKPRACPKCKTYNWEKTPRAYTKHVDIFAPKPTDKPRGRYAAWQEGTMVQCIKTFYRGSEVVCKEGMIGTITHKRYGSAIGANYEIDWQDGTKGYYVDDELLQAYPPTATENTIESTSAPTSENVTEKTQ